VSLRCYQLRSTTPSLIRTRRHNMNLTETAFVNLTKSLERFGNKLSIPHRKALYSLVASFTDMAQGHLTGRVAFPISTGCGKTRAIV